jgi:hypothetical protein
MFPTGRLHNVIVMIGFIVLLLLKPAHAQDLKYGEGISQWPESGHDNQAEKNFPALQKGRAKPNKMSNKNAGTHPICIMELPPSVSHLFKQLCHAGPFH